MSARVRNGQIVVDDPVELTEGAVVRVLIPEADDLDDAELEGALDDSAAQFERGEFEDARALAMRLVARS